MVNMAMLRVVPTSRPSPKTRHLLGAVKLLVKAVAIGCLVAMALLPTPWQLAGVVVPLYLVRTWLMNAPLALSKSVLNDYVPKRHRAKWASLESVNTSTWAGEIQPRSSRAPAELQPR